MKKLIMPDELQKFLNNFPGFFLLVDGKPGETSSAFKMVTGFYLNGDPRNVSTEFKKELARSY